MKHGRLHFSLLALATCSLALLGGCATRPSPRVGPHIPVITPPERPGLGTSWGETRASWVEPATFARSSATRPNAKGQLYYNDKEGIDAMLDYVGGEPRKATGPQPAGDVTFGLRGSDGEWLDTWELKGKRFSVGSRGQRYEVVLKNESKKPVEVLVSVDGLDALDGQAARFEKRGYVLDPSEELAVDGFRQSDGEVAAFRFSNMGGTYAQRRHGDTVNCGVVGIAVFREGRNELPTPQQPRRHAKPGASPGSREYAPPPPAPSA